MKFIVAILLSALLAFAAGLFFQWWSIAITSFIVGVAIGQRALTAYLSAFFGVALLWAALACWMDFQNQHILATKIANVLPLGGSVIFLIVATAIIGGLVSGFAGMTGSYLRVVRKSNRTT